jgi:3-oxoacyl-[acyl-carrier-protein] synthase III
MPTRIIRHRFRVLGTGAMLPGEPVATEALLSHIEQSFGLSIQRTGNYLAKRLGIRYRHICRDFVQAAEGPRSGHSNPELAAAALRQALAEAGLKANSLGYLFGHTTSPHTLLPPNIAWVADHLAYDNPYAELRQACTGFANALQLAAGMLQEADAAPIAIVGSETGSVYFDPRLAERDREQLVNLVQMGDGAGAVVLGPDNGCSGATLEYLYFGTLGAGRRPGFYLRGGGSEQPYADHLSPVNRFEHDFNGVRDTGMELFAKGLEALKLVDPDVSAINWFIPHQANAQLGKLLNTHLHIPEEKVFINADTVGNLGSAAIWVALHQLRTSGMLKNGDAVWVLGAEATKYLYGGFLYRHFTERK